MFSHASVEGYVPDGTALEGALRRTTHLAIGAHQDDLEIMAADGILACFGRSDAWFTGVVATDGRNAPREGPYAALSETELMQVRNEEQRAAAEVGRYSAVLFFQRPSGEIKTAESPGLAIALDETLAATRPRVVYTHNLADKHDTHVALSVHVIEALRRLPEDARPEAVYGCEVWRDLDWLCGDDKVVLDVSKRTTLQSALIGVFDSQIEGGKRYDLAIMGRRQANATFLESHGVDQVTGATYATDLSPLLRDPTRDPLDFATAQIDRFREDVAARIRRYRR